MIIKSLELHDNILRVLFLSLGFYIIRFAFALSSKKYEKDIKCFDDCS